ncbi:MAG: TolC family protein [Thermodesulfovibrionales bacterium]|nr:TolC family protein [Thermodesulfovibrionales bacterium]
MRKTLRLICIYFAAICIVSVPALASSLTIDEAISLSKENLPSYKASAFKVRSTGELYKASLSPYLPTLDASASYNRHYASSDEYDSKTLDLTLSYTVFDGGKRKADRSTAKLNFEMDREELQKSLIELEYSVKVAFYTAVAQREILKQRNVQLQDAQKDYEVAEGRYKFGVAKLSDVLQASVRLEQARFNLIQAEGDSKKALSELNSLIGKSLDSQYEIQGTLDTEVMMPDKNRLYEIVFHRPEIKQAEKSLKISENNISLSLSAFYPVVSLTASYAKTDGSRINTLSPEEKTAGVVATWNIFELGKFFKKRSSEFEKNVATEELNEVKRQFLLEVHKTYEDLVTASNKLKVAEQQLKQAEHNYSQAFGEYKVGKADILSLVQAESLLSIAREQLVSSKLNITLVKAQLERVAGVRSLESLSTVTH